MRFKLLVSFSVVLWFVASFFIFAASVVSNIGKTITTSSVIVLEDGQPATTKTISLNGEYCINATCTVPVIPKELNFTISSNLEQGNYSYNKKIRISNSAFSKKEGFTEKYSVDLKTEEIKHLSRTDLNPEGTFYNRLLIAWIIASIIAFLFLLRWKRKQLEKSSKNKKKK